MGNVKLIEIEKVICYDHKVTEKPLVSVSVVTYNHANYINQCLDGILLQNTSFPFEILLGEDASSDGTREICIEYANKYPDKIRLFLHSRENNIKIGGHPTGRFNFLYNLSKARGKYIALCEGDDYWINPFKLQKQVDYLEKNQEYALVAHRIHVVDRNGYILERKIGQGHNKCTITQLDCISQGIGMHHCSLVYRNVLKDLPDYYYKVASGDSALVVFVLGYGNGYFFNEIMSCYRINESGIWSNTNQLYRNVSWLNLETFQLIEYPVYKKVLRKKIRQRIKWIAHHLDKNNIIEFLSLWRKAIVYPIKYSIFHFIRIILMYFGNVIRRRFLRHFPVFSLEHKTKKV